MSAMREFMDDDIAQQARRQEEERGIQHDDASRRAAAPLRGGEAHFYFADANVVGFFVYFVYERSDAWQFLFGEQRPKKAMQACASNLRAYVDFPSRGASHGARACAGRESYRVFLSRCNRHGLRLSAAEEMAKRIDDFFFSFFQDQMCHSSEERLNVFLFLGSGEISCQTNDDGIAFADGT